MATKEEITELAKKAKSGDSQAEADFVEATIGKLRAKVKGLWSSDQSGLGGVTDVVNSTYQHFLMLIREKESEIRDAEALLMKTALLRIRNRIRALRTQKRDPARESRGDTMIQGLRSAGPTPSSATDLNEDLVRLATAMKELPEEDQALLLCRASGEGTWEAIALVAGKSVKTLQRRHGRLLRMLRAQLDRG